MEQRDLLKDQIEQIGKVLGKILADFLGIKATGDVAKGIELCNQQLQGELDINIEKLVPLNKAELIDYIKERKLTGDHLEALSEYLKQIGLEEMKQDKNKAKIYLKKALELLDIAIELSKTISLNGMHKQAEIKSLLQEK